jgi:formamidopyrimidine-DNA glycosylase
MPELPEVQTVVNDLKAAGIVGSLIVGSRVFWQRTIDGISPQTFAKRIKGKSILSIWRRGKFIGFDLNAGLFLLVHLRMTGRLLLVPTGVPRTKHEHVVLKLEDQRQLRMHDTRKFGRFYLVNDPGIILGRLGPEPLAPDVKLKFFSARLGSRNRQIKPLLLDQNFIAGIGNIYADEALWEAKIHPQRISSSLQPIEVKALYKAIPKVLKQGLRNMGTTLGSGRTNFYSIAGYKGRNRDQLKVFRREGLPCPRCKALIRRTRVGQRSTFVCIQCQNRGRFERRV